MKRSDRLLCIACSFVPAIAVWLSYLRYEEFISAFKNLLSFEPALRTTFVLTTIRFWPYAVVLGWLLLVPAMFRNDWARKFRVVLTYCYLVLGPVLYAICLHGLFDAAMFVSSAVLQQRPAGGL